jgi:hypothetical protein
VELELVLQVALEVCHHQALNLMEEAKVISKTKALAVPKYLNHTHLFKTLQE